MFLLKEARPDDQAIKKLISRLLWVLPSTEIFSKRRKIFSIWKGTGVAVSVAFGSLYAIGPASVPCSRLLFTTRRFPGYGPKSVKSVIGPTATGENFWHRHDGRQRKSVATIRPKRLAIASKMHWQTTVLASAICRLSDKVPKHRPT